MERERLAGENVENSFRLKGGEDEGEGVLVFKPLILYHGGH